MGYCTHSYVPPTCYGHVYLSSVQFRMCVHLFPMSVLLLMLFGFCRFLMMKYFSERQRSHDFCPGVYIEHFLMILKTTSGLGFSLFCQIYVDKVVSF